MKKKLKLKGALKAYLQWPLFMTLLLCIMDACLYLVDKKTCLIGICFTLLYLMLALTMYLMKRPVIVRDLVRFAASYGQVQRKLLKELSIPYAVLDTEGHILWGNDEFRDIMDSEHFSKRSIAGLFPDITKSALPRDENDVSLHVKLAERNYCVVLRRVVSPDFEEDVTWSFEGGVSESGSSSALIALYLYDETEIMRLKKDNQDQKLITGLLYIDNYEEALESIDEVRRSLLIALVDRKINKYMQEIDAIIKKLEKDKYIFVFQQKYLPQLQNNKFSILEDVRAVNIGNEMSVTISIGLGVNMDSYARSYETARAAIDLALGRGGDQAVVRENDKISYYGGKSVQVEKSTRVKARVKAHALKEFVEAKDKVVIMGHSIGDVDSFGSAIGVYRIAKTLNKRAYIVINDITTSVRPMINRFLSNPDYEEDMFLNSEQAMGVVDLNTLLVVVDVNRPSITECKELLNQTRTVVVLDHHRQTGEAIEGAVLSYIEPYASSACEMVAEILQYIGEGLKIRQAEADAMYAGIMIDTNNFLTKTGVRTFEAAAFLRRNGADVTRIRKAFRTEMQEFKVKAEAITNVEVFLNYYVLTECGSEGIESPTILGAQVANELLNVVNVKASFVFTEYNNKIFVSARSIDEVNVQVVMEKLGGGGHMSAAGVQFKDCTVREAMQRVKDVLSAMTQEGDI